MKTTVINLYGGPGCGKSTTAAGLFYEMKKMGKSVELVREYVKDWAWEGRVPGKYDQPHFFGEQCRRESLLYGKVEYVVTDSPLLMNVVYDKLKLGMEQAVESFIKLSANNDVRHLHFVLNRTKTYKTEGRYHSEQEAQLLDAEIVDLLRSKLIPLINVNVSDDKKVSSVLNHLGYFI